jgi:hypothetical protein
VSTLFGERSNCIEVGKLPKAKGRKYPKNKGTSTSKDYMDFNLRVKISAQVVAIESSWKSAKQDGGFAEILTERRNIRKYEA